MPSNDDSRRIAFKVCGSNPDAKEFTDFLGEFNRESDRWAVLASAGYIDTLLAETLRSFLIDSKSAADMVDEYPGAMISFSSRIMACHDRGLFQTMSEPSATLSGKCVPSLRTMLESR
jgi:hypothetical protein